MVLSSIDDANVAPANRAFIERKNNVPRDPRTTVNVYRAERTRRIGTARFAAFPSVRGKRKSRLICTAKVFVTRQHSRTHFSVQKSILPRAAPYRRRSEEIRAPPPVTRHPSPVTRYPGRQEALTTVSKPPPDYARTRRYTCASSRSN